MNVALPEVDGRVLTRAVSFKSAARFDEAVEANIVSHEPLADRGAFVARLAAGWVRLGKAGAGAAAGGAGARQLSEPRRAARQRRRAGYAGRRPSRC